MQAEAERAEAEYWTSIPYDEAVNAKIRERYTESQEFAILRQRDEKPTEYAEYYAYCEECKAFVKAKKGE
jgi:head-tail adaptor